MTHTAITSVTQILISIPTLLLEYSFSSSLSVFRMTKLLKCAMYFRTLSDHPPCELVSSLPCGSDDRGSTGNKEQKRRP